MQASAFEATVHDEERRALIRLEGDLDGNARERLAAAYEEAAVLQPSFIVLDFTRVGYINSTGIAAIVECSPEPVPISATCRPSGW